MHKYKALLFLPIFKFAYIMNMTVGFTLTIGNMSKNLKPTKNNKIKKKCIGVVGNCT